MIIQIDTSDEKEQRGTEGLGSKRGTVPPKGGRIGSHAISQWWLTSGTPAVVKLRLPACSFHFYGVLRTAKQVYILGVVVLPQLECRRLLIAPRHLWTDDPNPTERTSTRRIYRCYNHLQEVLCIHFIIMHKPTSHGDLCQHYNDCHYYLYHTAYYMTAVWS